MFESLQAAPPDPILGLTEAFRDDGRANKVNLAVGVYKDATGNTPIFASVKKAEQVLVDEEITKSYLPIDGDPAYVEHVRGLLFGSAHPVVAEERSCSVDTPGGTGALRVAAEFLRELRPHARVWLSKPTWPNHPAIFESAGFETADYPYYDADTKSLDFDGMSAALRQVSAGDVVLLHGCCHNPSGIDPDREQWKELVSIAQDQGFLILLDFAYQGLGDGLDEDAVGLRLLADADVPMLIANSFSKNFGLYRERVGAMTVIAENADRASVVLSLLKRIVRAMYSNPPAHGAAIVSCILSDSALRKEWQGEVIDMCARINAMRSQFGETIAGMGVDRDFSFLARQKGMFSFTGLTPEQVDRLREEHAVYMVRSGRVNVAGLTPDNMDSVCSAIAAVLSG